MQSIDGRTKRDNDTYPWNLQRQLGLEEKASWLVKNEKRNIVRKRVKRKQSGILSVWMP